MAHGPMPRLDPAVVAHIDALDTSLRKPGDYQYYAPLFRDRLQDRIHLDWPLLPVHEQIAYLTLLSAAVQSCDDVECDPVSTAWRALEAVRPLLRGQ